MPTRKRRRPAARELRHRINAGRVAVRDQTAFFERQFGQVASEWKEDDTRVTFADFAIAEKVFAELRRDFPRDDYCSEEASPLDEAQNLEADYCWLIDPIDGTNNYALGFPVCAISLALLYEGEPVYGFVYDFSVRRLLEGGPGFGLSSDRKALDRDAVAAEAQTMLGLHFPVPEERLTQLAPLLTRYRVRCLGSATLSFAYVATGYLTGAVDFRVKVWDVAAAYALCRGAGLDFGFVGERPFPMRRFHPEVETCPCFAGAEEFCQELRGRLGG
jgi:myo-inositol-1(or 4)-monophosphatase